MDILSQAIIFIGGMHISAVVIIGAILLIFFLSLIFSLSLRFKYKSLSGELERQAAIGKNALAAAGAADDAQARDRFSQPRFKSPALRAIAADYETAWTARKGADINTQAIIENNVNSSMKSYLVRERFVSHAASVMIILGLLGTFIGLTLSVQSLVLLFRGYDVTELLSSVESGLLSALVGMSTAFTTSLFGIGCSVVLSIMNIFLNPARLREDLMTSMEEYLDNIAPARMSTAFSEGYDKMNEALRRTFVDFGERIAERFDRALTTLRDDVRGIEDVNNNLRNTIEQMDVSFVRIADALKASTKHVEDDYQSLADLSGQLERAGAEFGRARKENAEYAHELDKNISEAARAIGALTGDLRGEAQRRIENFTAYEAAIAQMARSAELIRVAVAAIPEQMFAYSEASASPAFARAREEESRRASRQRNRRDGQNVINELNKVVTFDETPAGGVGGGTGEAGGFSGKPGAFGGVVSGAIGESGGAGDVSFAGGESFAGDDGFGADEDFIADLKNYGIDPEPLDFNDKDAGEDADGAEEPGSEEGGGWSSRNKRSK